MPTADAKYLGAWQETAARIQSRDQALVIFITGSSALISIKELAFANVVVGYVALAVSLLVCHHDLIIGYLGHYQSELAATDQKLRPALAHLPEWFSKETFSKGPLAARTLRDVAQFGIFLGTSTISLIISWLHIPCSRHPRLFCAVWSMSVVCAFFSLIVIAWTWCKRRQLANEMKSFPSP